ncbi:MAG: MG2 domain-containing protein [Cytophagaceae bacterium]|nr:MG2 domain-containing protein [Cytophagaceae bacterium]
MIRFFFQRILCILILALTLSCSKKDVIQIEDLGFGEEIETQQNLVIILNKDVAFDSIIGNWLDESLIEFEPKVAGKFKFTAANEITFSPTTGFAPSTPYKGTLSKTILNYGIKGLKLSDENTTFTCHTPLLNLSGISSYWTKNDIDKTTNELKIDIQFNYTVSIGQLKSLLSTSIDSKKIEYQLYTNTNSSKVTIGIKEINNNFDNKKLTITVAPGLKCLESNYTTTSPLQYEDNITSKSNFLIISCTADYTDEGGRINIVTNQEVYTQTIDPLISLSPSKSFSIEKHESGFYIKGSFTEEDNFTLTISKELQGLFGGKLKEDFSQEILFGQQKPLISFVSQNGIYLSEKGSKNVAIKILNIPKVRISVYKIYENNILSFFRNNSINYYDEYYEEDYYGSNYYGMEDYGDQVLNKTIDTKTLKKINGTSVINLNLSEINDFKGIYVIKVNSEDDQWIKDSKIISISDIGILSKYSRDELYVMANSIHTTEGLSGAKVQLISHNNQTIASFTTDKDGLVKVSDLKKTLGNFRLQMITINYGNDFNYLHLDQTRIDATEFETGGAYENESGYDAFIYGDRDIYRPGETIYLNTIVRTNTYQPLADNPIKLRVLLPNGKEFQSIKGKLNDQGAFATSLSLPTGAITGSYIAEVYSATDILLASKNISVEEFMPDRIKVNGTISNAQPILQEKLKAGLQAFNLFGPPASNRNYEMELSLNRKVFYTEKYKNYNFHINATSFNQFDNDIRQGVTDKDGKGEQTYSFPEEFNNSGILEGKVFMTVFDESGRPVHQVQRFDVFTQSVFLGIKPFDYWISSKTPINIELAALNSKGIPITSNARVVLVKKDWHTVLQKVYDDYYKYVSQMKETVMEDKVINLTNGRGIYAMRPYRDGSYEIRIYNPGASSYVSENFYAYGWGSTTSTSFEINPDGKVEIVPDKQQYNVGEKAKLMFKTPFAGKLLVTLERNKIYEYHILETTGRSASLEVSLTDNYLPNIFVSATLIKPHVNQNIPLTVAHGYQALNVNKASNKLPVEITIPEKIKSGVKQTIKVKAGAESNVRVTIAVVDEGILQIKNTKTPDPYQYFYRFKALQVQSNDIYAKLLAELSTKNSSIAGDGYNLSKRVNPLANKRIKLMAYWSGELKTNSDGEATYTIDIPKFSGDLRVMAVAYKDSKFGSANKNMKVADPIVVSTSLPRFMSPKDSITVPITVTNTTSQSMQATVQLTAAGAAQIVGGTQQSVRIEPNSEKLVYFTAKALSQIGQAQFKTSVQAGKENSSETIDITIRPASTLEKKYSDGYVDANSQQLISTGGNFIPSSTKTKLTISKSPLTGYLKNLDYLIGYPYGCIEQTTSRVFPQLYIRDLIRNLKQSNYGVNTPEYNIQEGIKRLYTMQTYNGGFSYWPGGYEDHWWGTAYATHFLVEAKKAGFEVEATVLKNAIQYLKSKVKEKGQYSIRYYDDANSIKTRVIAAREIFYSLYVLSLINEQDVSVMNYYKINTGILSEDSKYLLAGTYLRIGDQASYRYLLPSNFGQQKTLPTFGGSFSSYIRDMAIVLDILVENDPNNPQIPTLSKHLAQSIKNSYYLNTQETSFTLLALGKMAKKNESGTIQASVQVNGKTIGTFENGVLVIKENLYNKSVTISTKGEGKIYYFWEAEGLDIDGKMKEEDSYLQIRRTYYDRKGTPLTNKQFIQNDLIVVRLDVRTTDGSIVENVVVSDILPAGFEIENPRLNDYADMNWIKNKSEPDHFDMRDDRIHMFTTVRPDTKTFYYMVRAVSIGQFISGPATADAMYNGEYHSYNGSGIIRISQR